jgi:hypothetical protein
VLVEKVYYQKNMTGQWLVAKTIPVFKMKVTKMMLSPIDLLQTYAPLPKSLKN